MQFSLTHGANYIILQCFSFFKAGWQGAWGISCPFKQRCLQSTSWYQVQSRYSCVSSWIAVCLTAKLMETSSQRQKECNPLGIQQEQSSYIPAASRGCSHLVGDGECMYEMGVAVGTQSSYKSQTSTNAFMDKALQLLQCWYDDAKNSFICHGKL